MFVPADSGHYPPAQSGYASDHPTGTAVPVKGLPDGLATIIGRIVKHGARSPKLSAEERGRAEGYAVASGSMNEQLAMVSHELRNFVGVIRNATRLLAISENQPLVAEKARLIIDRQVGQMGRLIDDLLEISLAKSGRLFLRRERVDLRVVAKQAVESLDPEIERRHQRLTAAFPEAPVWLHADPVRLLQVLVNLLGNAAKYTDSGGNLWLSVERKAGGVIIRVRDSGIGIAAVDLPHVFEPFMRASSSLSRCETGHGIGLALVRSLVELHGGRVDATSAGVGQGSEFTVHLPATFTMI